MFECKPARYRKCWESLKCHGIQAITTCKWQVVIATETSLAGAAVPVHNHSCWYKRPRKWKDDAVFRFSLVEILACSSMGLILWTGFHSPTFFYNLKIFCSSSKLCFTLFVSVSYSCRFCMVKQARYIHVCVCDWAVLVFFALFIAISLNTFVDYIILEQNFWEPWKKYPKLIWNQELRSHKQMSRIPRAAFKVTW